MQIERNTRGQVESCERVIIVKQTGLKYEDALLYLYAKYAFI